MNDPPINPPSIADVWLKRGEKVRNVKVNSHEEKSLGPSCENLECR